MQLIVISNTGEPEAPIGALPVMAHDILRQTASLYRSAGYVKPWVGYLAIKDRACVGFCAFKSPPRDGAVEIAYATMPEHEGCGIATSMAHMLIERARQERPDIVLRAQTLPEKNASTAILLKLGFRNMGTVKHPEDGLVWEWRLVS